VTQYSTSDADNYVFRPLTSRDLLRLAAEFDETAKFLESGGCKDPMRTAMEKLVHNVRSLRSWHDWDGPEGEEGWSLWDLQVRLALDRTFDQCTGLTGEFDADDCSFIAEVFSMRAKRLRVLAEAPNARSRKDIRLDREEMVSRLQSVAQLARSVGPESDGTEIGDEAALLAWDLADWPARLNSEDDTEFVALVEQARLSLYEIAGQRVPSDIEARQISLVEAIGLLATAKMGSDEHAAAPTGHTKNHRHEQAMSIDFSERQPIELDLNDLRPSKQRQQLIRLLDDEERVGIETDPVLVRRIRFTLRKKATKLRKPGYAHLANAIIEVEGRPSFRKVSIPSEQICIIRPKK